MRPHLEQLGGEQQAAAGKMGGRLLSHLRIQEKRWQTGYRINGQIRKGVSAASKTSRWHPSRPGMPPTCSLCNRPCCPTNRPLPTHLQHALGKGRGALGRHVCLDGLSRAGQAGQRLSKEQGSRGWRLDGGRLQEKSERSVWLRGEEPVAAEEVEQAWATL